MYSAHKHTLCAENLKLAACEGKAKCETSLAEKVNARLRYCADG